MPVPVRPPLLLELPPDRALVLESQGRLFGVPLSFVSQIVSGGEAFCPLPTPGGPVAGLYPHAQVLWPLYSLPGLLGESASREDLLIFSELAGQSVAITAARVGGVQSDFRPTGKAGEFVQASSSAPIAFLDLQRMFS